VDAERLLHDLDERQRAAVTTPSTLVAVVASAGSGKTRVLTRRIVYRVAVGTADAGHTLALTFTREAAGELRRRLRRSGLREPVEAGTFHSVALGLLRQRWFDTGRPAPAIINDPERLLAEVADGVPVPVLTTERSWLAARAVDAREYSAAARTNGRRAGANAAKVEAALLRYEVLKRRRGVIDLDDLISLLGADLENDAEFAAAVRWRFRHVLVDEAQDLNPAQFRLLRGVTAERNDLFLVGDPAQAIYGFNGSDPSLLADADVAFPGVEIIRLRSNHRCTPQVVGAGMHVLATAGLPAESTSARADGPGVELISGADEIDEAERVATVLGRVGHSLVRDGHVAVLARTHEQLALLRRTIEATGLPTRRTALAVGSPLAAAARHAAQLRSASQLRAWAHDVLETAPDPGAPHEPDAEAQHRVASAVLDFLRDSPLGDGAAFRAWVATTHPFSDPGDADGIELLTFHAAKGREWHTVVVTGVETGLVPHRSAGTVDGRAEEARLLHVAFTRASDRLIVTRAERRRGYVRQLSPFLAGFADATAAAVPLPAHLPEAVAAAVPPPDATRLRVESLHAWRESTARATAMLPAQICSESDLAAIAASPPDSPAELAALGAFGPATAALHYDAIRAALDDAG
jgi:DNA helicase-2/ATP-dependent DNA helicase PcrA